MPSVTYTLGVLEHVYDRQNLKLKNSGFIKISSPQASEFPFSLNFRDLEALVSSKIWVAGGNQLQIEIDISFDDIAISGQEDFDVIEELGVVLCNAEIWSQLNLNASLSLPESPIDKGSSLKRLLITLTGQPSSHRNVQPPAGVPSARLDSVSFAMKFSTCRRIRLPLKERRELAEACTPSIESSFSRFVYSTHNIDLEELVRIANASLQIMICDRRPAKAGGIILSSDEGYPKLAALSPALFSPGYARAISRCESLLSTISRTISGVYCRTRSQGLRHKMEKLLDIATDRYIQEERPSCEHTESRSSNLTSAVNARLWFLIQRRLNDPPGSKKFKSFAAPKKGSKLNHASETMLDESLTQERDEEAMFDSQDTLLAEDFSQAQEVFDQEAMDWKDEEDGLLLDEETPVGDQFVELDHLWKELDEGEDLFGASQSRFESTTDRANVNQDYDEPLEDGDVEILEDQILDEHQHHPIRDHVASNRWQDELLEDTMMTTTS